MRCSLKDYTATAQRITAEVMAALEKYQGIPHSTLSCIAKIGMVLKKCRPRFPGVVAIDNRLRITIHKESMESAATTIIKHVKPTSRIAELITLLHAKPKDKHSETELFQRLLHLPGGFARFHCLKI